ncbi:hypothetical protein ACFV27_03905 [Streptomyces antimycoticus]|uniref:Uncharacterized protein n=2 Tax=Streptomyces TaxID=1883 RepID=A0ABD5JF27_9ACTN|nr:hypothetical protein [Streptomyces violaceusniger]MEE4587006.1 hypothetical protein [Streptomyces sp. DSM 41602]WTA84938.1 hypothetical protein OG751_36550 [Streptomyces antimycoticus]
MHREPPPVWPDGARCAVMLSFDHIGRTGDVWFAPGAQIAGWWRSQARPPRSVA